MFIGQDKTSYKKAYYLTDLEETPKHIKYRYYADLKDGSINNVGLECVTKIGSEYVAFKDIFKVNTSNIETLGNEIKEHIDLFFQILKSPSSKVVFE